MQGKKRTKNGRGGSRCAAKQQDHKTRYPQGSHCVFLNTQSLIIAASVEEYGRVWSSFLTGEPGFIEVEDEVTLTIQSNPVASDPLTRNLLSNPELGLLAIDFSKRIRMRINGTGAFDADRRLVVKTECVNCGARISEIYGNRHWDATTFFECTSDSCHKLESRRSTFLAKAIQIILWNFSTIVPNKFYANLIYNYTSPVDHQ